VSWIWGLGFMGRGMFCDEITVWLITCDGENMEILSKGVWSRPDRMEWVVLSGNGTQFFVLSKKEQKRNQSHL
jgi:hypothetical protein